MDGRPAPEPHDTPEKEGSASAQGDGSSSTATCIAASRCPSETGPQAQAESFMPLEDLLYWTEREEGVDMEPLGYLGAHFPSGCRFCI